MPNINSLPPRKRFTGRIYPPDNGAAKLRMLLRRHGHQVLEHAAGLDEATILRYAAGALMNAMSVHMIDAMIELGEEGLAPFVAAYAEEP